MLKLILVIASIYLALVAIMFFNQRSLLYQPSKYGLSTEQADAFSLKKWPDDLRYRGYLHDPIDARRTVVIFHGNAGEAAHRNYYLDTLAATHARIILVEYPGYGQRSGSPSEKLLVNDAITTLELAADAFPHEPLLVIGESMGAGVASAAIASVARDIQGLVLITPWDSLTNLAETHYRFLPVRWLLLDRYDSINNLQNFDGPKAIVIAGKDTIVPARHGDRLFQNIPPIKARFMLDQAQHNNWLEYVDDKWWLEILTFLNVKTTPTASNQ
ncbi:MAG: pimeloyl-ACP methyl ester carboxylesterase [Granulosicoccus sp.]|jgi:pimeloyl-ACP methyl ester carboxylesterase